MLHLPDMEDNVPSATQTLSRPKLTEYDENSEDKLTMWLEAPEFIIQDRDVVEET